MVWQPGMGECRNGGRAMDTYGSPEMPQRIKMGVCHTSFFEATAEPLSGLILARKTRGWMSPTFALGFVWQHVLRVIMASLAGRDGFDRLSTATSAACVLFRQSYCTRSDGDL